MTVKSTGMQDRLLCWVENLSNILCLQNEKGIFISINSYVTEHKPN